MQKKKFPMGKAMLVVLFSIIGLLIYLQYTFQAENTDVMVFAGGHSSKISSHADVDEMQETSLSSEENPISVTEQSTVEKTFPVYITGEVKKPGIYVVDDQTYIYEVIDLAGGFTADAAQELVNLAIHVEEYMQIHIPSRERISLASTHNSMEYIRTSDASQTHTRSIEEKININEAGVSELQTITGIGEKTAASIIKYREEHGRFSTIEDIMKVPGIKEQRFSSIKEYIEVK